jgi:hypothetical protein
MVYARVYADGIALGVDLLNFFLFQQFTLHRSSSSQWTV